MESEATLSVSDAEAPLSLPAHAGQGERTFEYAERWLGRLSLALSTAYLIALSVIVVLRVRYPFELEWIEGGLLDEMRRVRAGESLYVAPSLSYVPFVYNPLYFWVSALFSFPFGQGFFAMRLVSALSLAGSLLLIAALVRRETGSRALALLGAGGYAATFKLSEQFMDLARVDSLFVFLLLGAACTLRRAESDGQRALGALWLVAGFLVKQSGMLCAAPLVLFMLWDGLRERGATWLERLSAAMPALLVPLGIGLSVLLLDALSAGWYTFYAFDLPRQHRLVDELWLGFWTRDLMAPLACACLGALFVILGPSGFALRTRLFWASLLAGVLLMSWSSRLHDGGWNNVIMPSHAVLAALFAIAVGVAFESAHQLTEATSAVRFVQLVACLQLAMLLYDPQPCVPSAADEEAGWTILETLRARPGDVFVPSNSYLSTMAGKRPHLHEMAVRDLLRAEQRELSANLTSEIAASLRERRWSAVITDNDFFAKDVLANYQRIRLSVPDPKTFFPVAGAKYRPDWLFYPK